MVRASPSVLDCFSCRDYTAHPFLFRICVDRILVLLLHLEENGSDDYMEGCVSSECCVVSPAVPDGVRLDLFQLLDKEDIVPLCAMMAGAMQKKPSARSCLISLGHTSNPSRDRSGHMDGSRAALQGVHQNPK